MSYLSEIKRSMNFLAGHEQTVFLGQAVRYPGTGMFQTLEEIPQNKKIEMPVEEDFQMGVSIGLALNGVIPISIFPRWNFLLLATNQLANHLDKMGELIPNSAPPKVIVRTAIGSENPLHPGPQHIGDFTQTFRSMLKTINVVRLDESTQIFPEYTRALSREDGVSTILVEWSDKYHEE
jgi:pyruvate/2-oxoglutarate/acetoin dehydrogenase E1 component